MLHPLNIRQLVCSQKVTLKLLVQVRRERIGLHQVGDAADRRLWESVQAVVKPGLLVSDVAQQECPLRAFEPGPPGLQIGGPEWR
jgi:hypothetical protein